MKFTKFIFFAVLLFSANSFSMFKTARILRTLNQANKATLNKQNLLVQAQNNPKSFSVIKKDFSWVHKHIEKIDPMREIDPAEALKILNFCKKFKCDAKELIILRYFIDSGAASLKGNKSKTAQVMGSYFGWTDEMDQEAQRFFENRLKDIQNGEWQIYAHDKNKPK